MESSGGSDGGLSRCFGLPLLTSSLIQVPLSAVLEYSGNLRPPPDHSEAEGLIHPDNLSSDGAVTIRIIEVADQENHAGASAGESEDRGGDNGVREVASPATPPAADGEAGTAVGNARDSSSQSELNDTIVGAQLRTRLVPPALPTKLQLIVTYSPRFDYLYWDSMQH